MIIYTVVGYFLSNEPQTPQFVLSCYSIETATEEARAFCRKYTENVKMINPEYFSADLGDKFVEARIYTSKTV